jgi:hypothetical protein
MDEVDGIERIWRVSAKFAILNWASSSTHHHMTYRLQVAVTSPLNSATFPQMVV